MSADDHLARGLTDRFFRELTAAWNRSLEKAKRYHGSTRRSLTTWRREVRRYSSSIGEPLAHHFLADRKTKSYWIGCILIPDENADLKDWDERCIKVRSLRWDCSDEEPKLFAIHMVEISAHAIKRLLERSDVGYTLESGFQRIPLLDEVKEIINWIGLYMYVLPRLPPDTLMFPVIPATDGMFLCERKFNSGWSAISVRTYIARRQFSTAQARIYDALVAAYSWIGRVPFFLYLPWRVDPTRRADHRAINDSLYRLASLWICQLRDVWTEWSTMITTPPAGGTHQLSRDTVRERCETAVTGIDDSWRQMLAMDHCPITFTTLYMTAKDEQTVRHDVLRS